MELGYALIQQVLAFPFQECGEGFASLRDAVESSGVEMQFSDSKIAGQLERVYFMRESLVKDVITIGREMNARGWILKIEDCYRSLEMQGQLVRKPELFDIILKMCIWALVAKLSPCRKMPIICSSAKEKTRVCGCERPRGRRTFDAWRKSWTC